MTAAIYRAVCGDREVIGTSREIQTETGIFFDYVRKLAKSGRKTKDGWTISIVKPSDRHEVEHPNEYIAECIGEDPIIGPVSEIAALTGMDVAQVRAVIRTGKTFDGWSVRLYNKGGA